MIRHVRHTLVVAAMALVATAPHALLGQTAVRMSGGGGAAVPPPDGAAAIRRTGGPAMERPAYAGVWVGSMMVGNAAAATPLTVTFEFPAPKEAGRVLVERSGTRTSSTTVEQAGALTWTQSTADGKSWEYSAKLVTRDSVSGTATHKDGAKVETATFVLKRSAAKS